MACCELKAYTVSDINFYNRLDPNMQIKIGNKFSYNVKYPKDGQGNICRGEFEFETGDIGEDKKLNIKVVVVGIFSYSTGATKEMIHTDSFKVLYPYVKALVTTITANADIILSNKVRNIETVCKMLDTQGDVVKKMLKESIDGDSKAIQNL